MINVNDLKNGMTIGFDGNIYQVLEFLHVKPGKGPAFVRTKLKNLRTKATVEHTFNAGIKVEKAVVDKKQMQYLYASGDSLNFMDMDTYEQIEIHKDLMGDVYKYFKEGLDADIVFFEGEILDVKVPEKIEYKIEYTEPAIKGNSINNALKDATLENGLSVKVPLFIESGETIIISTKDGKYDSRA